jgi:replicative DNA helicase
LCQNGAGRDGTGIEEIPKNKGHFKCFKCDESGDVLHFIGKEYGLNSFPEILEKAYSIYGIVLDDKEYKREGNKDKMKKSIQKTNEKANHHDLFPEGENAVQITAANVVKSREGNDMLVVTLSLINGLGDCNFMLTMVEGKRWQLKALLEATGCYEKNDQGNYVFDTDDLIGKTLNVYIRNQEETYTDRNGDLQHKMKSNILKLDNRTSEPQEDFRDFFKKANENLNKDYDLNKTNYLLKRGISIGTQNKFKIGYVEGWVSPTALKKGNKPLPSPRIIIPTSDNSYMAREVRPDVKKYKAIKEGKTHLFNLDALSISIVEKEDASDGKTEEHVSNDNVEAIFIVEGEIDALSVIEAGGQSIGLGGTSNITSLINELEKGGEAARKRPYIICLDNDEAGKKASEKLQEELKNKGFVFTDKCEEILKTYKDPNEALVGNREEFIAAIKDIKSTALEMLEEEKENYIQEYKDKIANVFISFDTEKKTTKTGLTNLDKFLDGGLHAGLYVLAAASGAGKTTFALQIADNIAKTKQDVLFFSGEMTIHEIVAKSLSRMSKETAEGNNRNALTMRTILNVKATNNSEYKARLTTLASQNYPDIVEHVRIYDGLQEIENIEDEITKHKRITGNIPVIFIDYLQIIKNKKASSKEKRLQVDEIVSQLRIIAAKYETPVFVISSLNRTAYGRAKAGQATEPSDEKDIYMADLKESGGIEYGADVIMTLKTSKDDDGGDVRGVKVKIIKNRTGKRHSKGEAIKFKFHAMFNYFEDDGVLVESKGDKNSNKPTRINRKVPQGSTTVKI